MEVTLTQDRQISRVEALRFHSLLFYQVNVHGLNV